MRKLTMKMSVSVDGFVSGANGEMDWIFKTGDAQSKAWAVEHCREAGLHLMGRKSFETLAAYWPSSTDVFAEPMNTTPKALFTRKGFNAAALLNDSSPAAAGWAEARVLSGDLVTEVNALKAEAGKPINAIGGAEFMRNLIAAQLIDEFYLAIHPVILGSGLRIFDGVVNPLYLKLIDVKVFPGGTAVHIYGR